MINANLKFGNRFNQFNLILTKDSDYKI